MTLTVLRNNWMILVAAAATCLSMAHLISRPALLEFIEDSGINIPTGNILRDYGDGIIWACVLLIFVLVWPVRREHKKMLAVGWVLKCFVAMAVMLPYEERYWGLDCWTYFQRAHQGLLELAPGLMRGGAEIVIAIGALHLEVGPDSYHAMKLTFAMIGFVAIYLFYLTAEVLLGRHTPVAFWALTLYPSILFWSTILGKDPVILAAIALHVWGLVNVLVRGRNGYLVAVLAGIAATSAVRIWMGPILILPCLLILGARIKHVAWRAAAVLLIGSALAALGPATIERLELDKAQDLLEATRTVTSGWAGANSALGNEDRMDSAWDVLLFTPEGLFDAYFRPLPGDVANLFGWLAGLENLGLLVLFIWALSCVRLRYLRNHLFLWGAILLLTWGVAYSFVAYKDLGTAVRFKLQILPVLLGMIGFVLRQPSRHWAVRRATNATSGPATPYRVRIS